MHIELIKHLVSINKKLIESSAIKDCHCLGLNSFVINEKPRIRLFIANEDCELYNEVSPIPIHAHKYDDLFQVLSGPVYHEIYKIGTRFTGAQYRVYKYPRIKDTDKTPVYIERSFLTWVDTTWRDMILMPAQTLHTVRLSDEGERKPIIWMVTELAEDEGFEQIAYSFNPITPRPELYQPFPDAFEYVMDKFKSIK